ncbi:hypothetical protein ACFDR9_000301 [Janthinobacterium sp. CG_23.3]|nr:hypothetical protein [Janthinobacterium sp. CG_S6]
MEKGGECEFSALFCVNNARRDTEKTSGEEPGAGPLALPRGGGAGPRVAPLVFGCAAAYTASAAAVLFLAPSRSGAVRGMTMRIVVPRSGAVVTLMRPPSTPVTML